MPNEYTPVVQQIIDQARTKGDTTYTAFTTLATNAANNLPAFGTVADMVAAAAALPSITEPNVTIPTSIDTSSILSNFDTKYGEIVTMLAGKFADFRTAYFPDESNAYVAAENWLQAAIANPESGLPQTVQDQIFGDDQARIISEKVRAQDALAAQFAARRFPLPAGVMAHASMQLEQKAQDELAESSRKIAMLSVEMQKFSVEKLMALRAEAMDAAIKYISALASAPDVASKVIGVGYDAQSKLISSVSAFYNARTQAKEAIAKVDMHNSSLATEAAKANQATEMGQMEQRLKAMLAEMQGLAQLASSLYNNLHASASVSESFGRNIGFSYSNDTTSAAPTVT